MRRLAGLAATALVACHSERDDAERALARIEAESDRAAAEVGVPAVPGADLDPVGAGLRLLVRPDGIAIDASRPTLARWHRAERAFFEGVARNDMAALVPASPARLLALRAGRTDRSDYMIPALRERLRVLRPRPGEPDEVTIWLAPDIPFRTVAQLAYTATQSERPRLIFVVRQQGRPVALPLTLPRSAPTLANPPANAAMEAMLADAARLLAGERVGPTDGTGALPVAAAPSLERAREVESALGLRVALRRDGLLLTTYGGTLASGCERLAEDRTATTIPGGDVAALGRCLARVKREFPRERGVILTPDADTPWSSLAAVMHAARGPRGSLFPETAFGVTN